MINNLTNSGIGEYDIIIVRQTAMLYAVGGGRRCENG
jgi:hypothetical protein